MKRFFAIPLVGLLALAMPGRAQYPAPGAGTATLLVQSWYKHFLNREPDLFGATWVNALQAGQSPEGVLAGILTSDEYYGRGGNTPEGFVTQLYLDLTGRQPLPAEINFWVGRIYQSNRTDVAYQLLLRYPQMWQGVVGGNSYAAPPVPAPELAPYYPRTHGYEYRRPQHHYRR